MTAPQLGGNNKRVCDIGVETNDTNFHFHFKPVDENRNFDLWSIDRIDVFNIIEEIVACGLQYFQVTNDGYALFYWLILFLLCFYKTSIFIV